MASSRPANGSGDNSHIGRTLKDLYFNGETPRTEGRFEQLLDQLDSAERGRRHH
ncbi:hypothetical protein [Rhizobium sp. CC-YZS058]|uniref:hypothetical protein n=1 Tax=Rhizobium sp. CC-YZS058 TaxID=3042153 RepID=UPI002B062491|nr:hypothetical protein [Rhizobium sp. CC-YZS058]MEA3535968.1 hypothetical protein [Rhizobium sp. CC-YZS058]